MPKKRIRQKKTLDTEIGKIGAKKLAELFILDNQQMRHLVEKFNILPEISDAFDLVKDDQDRKIVQHLRKNGADGIKVTDILMSGFNFSLSQGFVSYTQEERAKDQKIEYAIRYINILCNNSLLTKSEVSTLHKIESRLKNKSFRFSRDTINGISFTTSKNGVVKPIYILGSSGSQLSDKFEIKKGLVKLTNAPYVKTHKQLTGVRMAALFDYAQKFNREQFSDKEIHGLILTLYKKMWNIEYKTNKIKKLIDNNKNIYKKFKSSNNTTKSKNVRTSIKS